MKKDINATDMDELFKDVTSRSDNWHKAVSKMEHDMYRHGRNIVDNTLLPIYKISKWLLTGKTFSKEKLNQVVALCYRLCASEINKDKEFHNRFKQVVNAEARFTGLDDAMEHTKKLIEKYSMLNRTNYKKMRNELTEPIRDLVGSMPKVYQDVVDGELRMYTRDKFGNMVVDDPKIVEKAFYDEEYRYGWLMFTNKFNDYVYWNSFEDFEYLV